jgi:triosephosphate isomerase
MQQPRIEKILRGQVLNGLLQAKAEVQAGKVVIGYEPIWAIGPGKVPPGQDYIAFVSAYIKRVAREEMGADVAVVYGGGLKEENAGMIASIETIGGGLVALTRFTGEILRRPGPAADRGQVSRVTGDPGGEGSPTASRSGCQPAAFTKDP